MSVAKLERPPLSRGMGSRQSSGGPPGTLGSPAPPRPTRLGPYEVGAKIGGGGMATIYLGLAAERKALEKLAALKVIKDELVHDEQHIAMFLDEAKILSRLDHPHIIRTLEFGVSGENRFIAMELLLGRPLEDLWQRTAERGRTFDFTVSAWLAARVAEGLHHAHELRDEHGTHLQVIHRDVNPSNIFITYAGQVKLIDFGLAKSIRRRAKSAEGIVKGKVPYLSPEQVTETSIDRRSDIYTLGTTLWEITTGKRLFKRNNDVETIMAIRRAEVPDPRATNPDYPDALWRIVEKALAPNRNDRYATAEALRTDLDRFVKASARDVPPKQRIGAILRKRLEETVSELFPGEHERQLEWLRGASDRTAPPPSNTIRPPAPLPEVEAQRESAAPGELSALAPPPVPAMSSTRPRAQSTAPEAPAATPRVEEEDKEEEAEEGEEESPRVEEDEQEEDGEEEEERERASAKRGASVAASSGPSDATRFAIMAVVAVTVALGIYAALR